MKFHNQFGREDLKIEEESPLYEGHLTVKKFTLKHRLFKDNNWSASIHRELIQRPAAVAVLPYNPKTQQILLIEQFRIGAFNETSPWMLELIAGLSEEGETYEAVAQREAEEEAGIHITRLIPVTSYYLSPGASQEKTYLYLGLFDELPKSRHHGLEHEGEDILSHVFSISDIASLIEQGAVNNASTMIALQWLLANQENL